MAIQWIKASDYDVKQLQGNFLFITDDHPYLEDAAGDSDEDGTWEGYSSPEEYPQWEMIGRISYDGVDFMAEACYWALNGRRHFSSLEEAKQYIEVECVAQRMAGEPK